MEAYLLQNTGKGIMYTPVMPGSGNYQLVYPVPTGFLQICYLLGNRDDLFAVTRDSINL